uniref:HIT domain-containing protein n=1 Tax=Cyclopterus lumpus TaxID=8103 RepID=A0A8C3G992_CYCLU
MATRDASGNKDCPFCQIADNQTDTEILLSDDELLCFRDITPGATHHYLVVPRTHIDNCTCLQGADIPLGDSHVGLIDSLAVSSAIDSEEMGFHVPPFSSVPHLHLHVLAPASDMTLKSQLRYGPQTHWFITVSDILSKTY